MCSKSQFRTHMEIFSEQQDNILTATLYYDKSFENEAN